MSHIIADDRDGGIDFKTSMVYSVLPSRRLKVTDWSFFGGTCFIASRPASVIQIANPMRGKTTWRKRKDSRVGMNGMVVEGLQADKKTKNEKARHPLTINKLDVVTASRAPRLC